MPNETIHTAKPDDNHSFYDYELRDAIDAAMDAATSEDDEACHFIHLENGMMISGIRVERETLSDGSKVCTIHLATV